MKMTYFEGQNYGDALNPWMWPQIFPNLFDNNDNTVFIGTGSIIGEREFPTTTKKIIFGAGFVPEYHTKPDISGADWDVFFVRGPRTAKSLGLSPDLSIGDSGIMMRTLVDLKRKQPELISFMPHWGSMPRGNWQEVCDLLGIHLIDPRRSVDEVNDEILRSKLIVTEAMHGAIIADAFRIPWIPVLPINKAHRNKWFDWAEALDMNLHSHALWPSSLEEARLSVLRKSITPLLTISSLPRKVLIHAAAYKLNRIIEKADPCLSKDSVLDSVVDRMQERAVLLRKKYS
jgi:succinoglycan biosynthesis protein ExoV